MDGGVGLARVDYIRSTYEADPMGETVLLMQGKVDPIEGKSQPRARKRRQGYSRAKRRVMEEVVEKEEEHQGF